MIPRKPKGKVSRNPMINKSKNNIVRFFIEIREKDCFFSAASSIFPFGSRLIPPAAP